jgi:hypothetical protein
MLGNRAVVAEGLRRKRRRTLPLLLLLIGAVLTPTLPSETTPATAAALSRVTVAGGSPTFWDGPAVTVDPEDASPQWLDGWVYELDVRTASERLRVGVDVVFDGFRQWADPRATEAAGSRFNVELLSPTGTVEKSAVLLGHSTELSMSDAPAGIYALRIVPKDGAELIAAVARAVRNGQTSLRDEHLRLRLRALSEQAATPRPKGEALPNLRILPPFEVAFALPTATYLPGVSESGADGTTPSCMVEEYEEEVMHGVVPMLGETKAAPSFETRCLRFSAGIENIGRGPLMVRHPIRDSLEDFTAYWDPEHPLDVPVYQRIYTPYQDDFRDREPGSSGVAQFHLTHNHLHFQDIYRYELFSYSNGVATDPVDARKRGVQPADEKLVRWDSFDNCPPTPAEYGIRNPHPCRYAYTDAHIMLGAGWADIYEWNRSGQYVPFPTVNGALKAGEYLLRGTADFDDHVLESDESDNVSYAHIVVGVDGNVRVLERGYGNGPRDPRKQVL